MKATIPSWGLLAFFLALAVPLAAQAPAGQPRITLQQGHTGSSIFTDISPDGRLLVSGSGDRLVKLWDRSTKKLIRTLYGHTEAIRVVRFSPDGRLIASAAGTNSGFINDRFIRLWDTRTGELVRQIDTRNGIYQSVYCLCFSPDGKYLAWGSWGSDIHLVNVADGNPVRNYQVRLGDPGYTYFNDLVFSPKGNYLMAAYTSMAVSPKTADYFAVWDVAGGQVVREAGPLQDYARSAALTDSAKDCYTLNGANSLTHWTFPKGEPVADNFIATEGQEICPDFYFRYNSGIVDKRNSVDHGVDVRLMATPIKTVSLTADGHYLASGFGKLAQMAEFDPAIRLWDLWQNRLVRVLPQTKEGFGAYALTPDGRYLVSNRGLWSMPDGEKLVAYQTYHQEYASGSLAIDLARRQALFQGSLFNKGLNLVDIDTGQTVRTFTRDQSGFSSLEMAQFCADGSQFIAFNSFDKAVNLWDVAAGKVLRSFTDPNISYVRSAAFSPDKSLVVINSPVQLNYTNGASRTMDLFLFDARTGTSLGPLVDIRLAPDSRESIPSGSAVAISLDSRLLAAGDEMGTISLWDLGTRSLLKRFAGSGTITSLAFSADNRLIISGSTDSTTRVWNVATGSFVAYLCSQDGKKWFMFDDEGYWDASPDGGDLIAMVQDTTIYNIDQFAVRNNRPDILCAKALLAPELVEHYHNQYLRRLRRLNLTEADLQGVPHVPSCSIAASKVKGKQLTLSLKLADTGAELRRYNVYVNDVPVFGAYGKAVKGTTANVTETIELTPGTNKIEASCMNDQGSESWRALTQVEQAMDKAKPDLWFIGFGVSSFKDPALNLRYADKDARDLANTFAAMAPGYAKVHSQVFTNEECTVSAIKGAKKLLDKARPEDTFVLFIAGHGVHDTDRDATYYFLTHETDIRNLKDTAADFDTIEDLLQGIAPRNKLFLMDTCESGELDATVKTGFYRMAATRGIQARAIQERGLANVAGTSQTVRPTAALQAAPATGTSPSAGQRSYLNEKDRYIYNDLARRSGAVVFSSCRGGEFSYESDQIGNGFFSHQIMQALRGKAAASGQTVGIDVLKAYVIREVPRLTDGKQNPTVDRDNLYQKFSFPVVGQEAGK